MSNQGIETILGGALWLLYQKPDDASKSVPEVLDLVAANGIKRIDSAVIYGDSEALLGEYKAGDRFIIDTKNPGGIYPGAGSKESVLKTGKESLEKLKVKQVDVLYLHAPDSTIPFEPVVDGMQELYQSGAFRRFGLSNFTVEQVKEVHTYCKSKGYVLPSVYQGNYNAFARTYERELIPALRSLNMSFYAYSPAAGGFLAKTRELVDAGHGRFGSGDFLKDMYNSMYRKPSLMTGLTKWNEAAEKAGIRPGEMALRWVKYNSILDVEHGDGFIIGGSSNKQLIETFESLKHGPLDAETVKAIDEMWEIVKDDAPVDNYHSFMNAGK